MPECQRLLTPIYSTVTHTIPYKNGYILAKEQPKPSLLEKTDESGLTMEERIIRFCETPRGKKEIARLIGISGKCHTWLWDKYLTPLVEAGKLKMTLPTTRQSRNQKFVSGDTAVPTAAAIIEFCNEPRTREEINTHFGLTSWTSWTQLSPLIESGKLKLEFPNRGFSGNVIQRITTQESPTPLLTDESLKEFCKTPRSRAEIIAHFDLEPCRGRQLIAKKTKSGIIKMTKPEKPDVPSQRFING